jgi:hypothetical protein
MPVPCDNCLALIGDSHGGNLSGLDPGLFEKTGDGTAGLFPYLQGIVLDPAGWG